MKDIKMTDKDLDKLLADWTEGLLPHDEDTEVTEKLISFIEDDTDIEGMMDAHIHGLAQNDIIYKSRLKRLSWISAAASVCLIVIASIMLLRDNSVPTNSQTELLTQTDIETEAVIAHSEPDDDARAVNIDNIEIKSDEAPTAKANDNFGNEPKQPTSPKPVVPKARQSEEQALKEAIRDMIAETSRHEKELANTLAEIDINFSDILDDALADMANDTELMSCDNLMKFNTLDNDSPRRNVFVANLIDAFSSMKHLDVDINFQ